jgi:uncharacterized oligopeptide transporter (OPT) family protein
MQTQDEIDEHWLRHIYKPDEKQLTLRALVAGCLLGGIMSVANLYIGMKVGWSIGMALTSVILAFTVFALLRRLRLVDDDFTKLENNTVASAASAAGYFCSAGMVSAVPALYLTQNITLGWVELALWVTAISFVGVLIAVPMRRQMIDIDRLPFPSGIAGAETIRSMHDTAAEALAKGRSLFIAAWVAAAFEIPYSIGRFGSVANPLTWDESIRLPGKIAGLPMSFFGMQLNSSLLMYGVGGILGPRVGLSLGAGAICTYALAGPWLAGHGIVTPGEGIIYRSINAWAVWPGVMMMIATSFLELGLR